jgi:hypothetical protein
MMAAISWGLLGPETLHSERRTRTLGVGAAVRAFDLAVPGLGGAWFGKQLFLATLGVAVADQARSGSRRVHNIETANAIEALACWLALNGNGWQSDARLRGAAKMQGKDDLSFATVRKSSFYVTQPMRMATVQPLRALELVESSGERFNAFSCSPHGYAFIDAVCSDFNPCYRSKSVLEHLFGWANGEHSYVKSSENLREAISPLTPLSVSARECLRERLVQGAGHEGRRRRVALTWVDGLRSTRQQSLAWDIKPEIFEEAHWHDLHAGALFFMARAAAIGLLDRVEAHMANQHEQRFLLDNPLPTHIAGEIESLRKYAQAFLDKGHDPSPGLLAQTFCRECVDNHDARLLAMLVKRDDRVLRLRERIVVPGAAFRGVQTQQIDTVGSQEEDDADPSVQYAMAWPEGISHRIHNLFLLNLDLHAKLGEWLGGPVTNVGGTP